MPSGPCSIIRHSVRLIVLALFVFLLILAPALFGNLRGTVEGPQAKDCHNGNAHSVKGQGVHCLILLTAQAAVAAPVLALAFRVGCSGLGRGSVAN